MPPPEKNDKAFIWDMLDAARGIQEIVSGYTYDDYCRNRTIRLAVERSLEIIGEAASRISKPFRQKHAEIIWAKIIAHRNVIVHEYGEIKNDMIWIVATEKVPELIAALERIYASTES